MIRFCSQLLPPFRGPCKDDLGGAGVLLVYGTLTGGTLVSSVMKGRN